ncbi:MAG: hypothetical protein V1743_07940 [Nanoarchaeota archaeon]
MTEGQKERHLYEVHLSGASKNKDPGAIFTVKKVVYSNSKKAGCHSTISLHKDDRSFTILTDMPKTKLEAILDNTDFRTTVITPEKEIDYRALLREYERQMRDERREAGLAFSTQETRIKILEMQLRDAGKPAGILIPENATGLEAIKIWYASQVPRFELLDKEYEHAVTQICDELGIKNGQFDKALALIQGSLEQSAEYQVIGPNIGKFYIPYLEAKKVAETNPLLKVEADDVTMGIVDAIDGLKAKYEKTRQVFDQAAGMLRNEKFPFFIFQTSKDFRIVLPIPLEKAELEGQAEPGMLTRHLLKYVNEYLQAKSEELGTQYRKDMEHGGMACFVLDKPKNLDRKHPCDTDLAVLMKEIYQEQGNHPFSKLGIIVNMISFTSTEGEPLEEIVQSAADAKVHAREREIAGEPKRVMKREPRASRAYDQEALERIMQTAEKEGIAIPDPREVFSTKASDSYVAYAQLLYVIGKGARRAIDIKRGMARLQKKRGTFSPKEAIRIQNMVFALRKKKLVTLAAGLYTPTFKKKS